MVDPHARTLDISVAGLDFTIHQSPGLLTSNRGGGTTGAVVWKITPLFAEWMASSNLLFQHGILHERSSVLELGSGIAGLVGLVVAPKVARYILTDQGYVVKLLKQNIEENTGTGGQTPNKYKGRKSDRVGKQISRVEVVVLDWEQNSLENLPQVLGFQHSIKEVDEDFGLDVIVACDCVFNENLIEPFVRTCASLCQFPRGSARAPSMCIIAQQLRSPEVFETWLEAMTRSFQVWRIPGEHLTRELAETAGFAIHVAILRER